MQTVRHQKGRCGDKKTITQTGDVESKENVSLKNGNIF